MIESVVVWKWKKPGYRSTFTSAHVNVMRAMVKRHYPFPHRFVCVTDDAEGIHPKVEVVTLDHLAEVTGDKGADLLKLKNATWPGVGPSCYIRLRAFSSEFRGLVGERFVSIDLDCVITDDLTPLWSREEDFVIYAPASAGHHYNGSMWMMTCGSRAQVWEKFDPNSSPARSNAAGCNGSDQGWIQYVLGRGEARWTADDGIFAYKRDCLARRRGGLPPGARVVVFHGKPDPWDRRALQHSPWIKDHYR